MSIQTYYEARVSRFADATAVGNTVTETIIVPDFTFEAGYFIQGRKLHARLWGVISNVVTAVPTITLRVRVGTTTLSATWVVTSGALSCNATANTNLTWNAEFYLTCRTAGTAGTGMIIGRVEFPNLTAGSAVGQVGYPNHFPASAPAAGTLNTEVANLMSISAQWSAANASNTITVNDYVLESLV